MKQIKVELVKEVDDELRTWFYVRYDTHSKIFHETEEKQAKDFYEKMVKHYQENGATVPNSEVLLSTTIKTEKGETVN